MRFVRGFEGFHKSPSTGTVVAMGNFDGVHRGHSAILSDVVQRARSQGLLSCFLSFHPHPLRVVAPERAPGMLQTLEEKIFTLSVLAPDVVVVVPFTWEFSQTPASEFISRYLNAVLSCRELHVGKDARFGRRREGDVEVLRAASALGAFDLHVRPDVMVNGSRVSSSRIRRAVLDGDPADAAACLGRPWTVAGEVVGGARRGRRIGFPTANIAADGSLMPSAGVYGAICTIGQTTCPVAVHVGPVPTFGIQSPVVEAHIVGFKGDITGKRLRVHLFERLRGIRRFDGEEALVDQISQDVDEVTESVRQLLDNRHSIAYKIARFDREGGDCW